MYKSLRILYTALLILSIQCLGFSQKDNNRDLTLDDLIGLALENNPGIKEQSAKTEISSLQKNIMESSLYPQISSNTNTSLSNENSLNSKYYSINSGINIDQVIWQKGKNKEIIKQYDALYDAEVQYFEGSKQNLILKIRLLYSDLQRYSELNKLSVENIKLAELFMESAKEKNKVGINKYSDILKAESDLAEAQYNSSNYTWLIKNIETQLSLYAGI
ncbi:MAG: hypothetical protein C0594_06020 [Marinilabiliales bacterium]|nr:MAG: hypothetical protein C0594_06020 [Marinilabiliales bacterium]